MHHGHHVGTTNRKKYTFKRFQCIQCFTALFRFKTTVGHPNIVGPILQWLFKKIHAPLTFCVHDLCVHGMCMACAWHVHDVCLPVMCLVCAWCVPGVCPDTVISTPPPTPPTHAMLTQPHTPPPHAGAVGAITAVAACPSTLRGMRHRQPAPLVPPHPPLPPPLPHTTCAAVCTAAAEPTAAARAATPARCCRYCLC